MNQKSGKRHWLVWAFLVLGLIAYSAVVVAGFIALPITLFGALNTIGQWVFVNGISNVVAVLVTLGIMVFAVVGLGWVVYRFFRWR